MPNGGVMFARQVIKARRVGIPQRLGRDLGWSVPLDASWSGTRNGRPGLVLRRATDGPECLDRVRVTSVWQVPVPAQLLAGLGVAIGDWVYLSRGSDGASVRLTPAASPTLRSKLDDGDGGQ